MKHYQDGSVTLSRDEYERLAYLAGNEHGLSESGLLEWIHDDDATWEEPPPREFFDVSGQRRDTSAAPDVADEEDGPRP